MPLIIGSTVFCPRGSSAIPGLGSLAGLRCRADVYKVMVAKCGAEAWLLGCATRERPRDAVPFIAASLGGCLGDEGRRGRGRRRLIHINATTAEHLLPCIGPRGGIGTLEVWAVLARRAARAPRDWPMATFRQASSASPWPWRREYAAVYAAMPQRRRAMAQRRGEGAEEGRWARCDTMLVAFFIS